MKVLITGGSRGIGKEICKIYIENGHDVLAPSRKELDLLDRDSISAFIDKYGGYGINAIINNAGINPLDYADDINLREFDECLQVNLIAPMMLARGFVPYMKEQKKGYIVNIGSVWGIVSKEKRTSYSMAKNGIHGLTNTLAVELGQYNILVNTVCPGFTNTELTDKNLSKQDKADFCADVPLGRFAEPCEIARLVYFLGSGSNTYITGQKIAIDGGFTVR